MSAWRNFRRRLFRAVLYVLLGWVVFSAGSVLAMRWIDPFTSAFILRARAVALIEGDRNFKFKRQWADYDAIAAPLKLAVIASEDQKFPQHWGFDLGSIHHAMEQRERGRVRGASTLSQQVAKNLYLWPGQSWVRKGIEAYFTVLIETLWPKRRILEIYLNIAEFGVGTYGAEAAGKKFFGKSAARLNGREAALLAAVLPNPKRLRVDKPSAYVRARQSWILGQMNRLGGPNYLAGLQ